MILTYYQAVELMTFLPVLLSSVDERTSPENTSAVKDTADTEVYEMWRYTAPGVEVNGADFY